MYEDHRLRSSPPVRRVQGRLIEAGDEALEVANQRYLLVEAYQNKQQEIYAGTPTHTIRDWLTNFRDAEAAYGYGYGYVGLLPKTAARGNREPKVTEERRRFLDEAIAQWYARPKQQKVRDVFVLYQRACLEQHIQPVYLHTAFLDDFFWRSFPYTQAEAMPLWRTCGESSPLSKETSRVCAQKARASSDVCQTLVVCERSHRAMKGEERLWRQASNLF